jgi:hypothetical protein
LRRQNDVTSINPSDARRITSIQIRVGPSVSPSFNRGCRNRAADVRRTIPLVGATVGVEVPAAIDPSFVGRAVRARSPGPSIRGDPSG